MQVKRIRTAGNYWENASRPQQLFHQCRADEIMYGGAAGGGKSRAIREDAFDNCVRYPGSNILILRRTFPELEKDMISKTLDEWPQEVADYKVGRRVWEFHNGSKVHFGYLDSLTDKYKFQSAEFNIVYWDELTHFHEEMYVYLLSRIRSSIPGVPLQMKSASNPGNIGNAWVKKRFKIYENPDNVKFEAPGGRTRCFIPAKLADNRVLSDADPLYIKRLEELPEYERKILLDGDWNVLAGAAFPEWQHSEHVMEPMPIPGGWRKWAALDWGGTKPFCILWFAEDWDANVYIYRELYGCKHEMDEEEGAYDKGVLWTVDQVAKEYHELSLTEDVKSVVADPSIWSHTGHDSTIASLFMDAGVPIIPGTKDRYGTKQLLHSMLKIDEMTGLSRLRIFSNCRGLVRTLPQLTTDPRRPEDVNTKMEDHPYDTLRYGLKMASMSDKFGIRYRGRDAWDEWDGGDGGTPKWRVA